MKKALISGCLAGFLLYFTADSGICLTCLDIADSVFSTVLTAVFVLCGIIALCLLIKQRTSLKMQFLSGLLTQLTFWGLFVLDSKVGITRTFVVFPDDNYAGGIVLLFSWLTYTGIVIAGLLFTAVVQYIRKSANA